MAIDVKGGFWGELGATLTLSSGESPIKRRIAQWLNKRQLRGFRELMIELNGVAAGQAALAEHTRVAASEELGGVRAIETVTDVDRVTAAADVTNIADTILSYPLAPTYVVNKDGNPRQFPGG